MNSAVPISGATFVGPALHTMTPITSPPSSHQFRTTPPKISPLHSTAITGFGRTLLLFTTFFSHHLSPSVPSSPCSQAFYSSCTKSSPPNLAYHRLHSRDLLIFLTNPLTSVQTQVTLTVTDVYHGANNAIQNVANPDTKMLPKRLYI